MTNPMATALSALPGWEPAVQRLYALYAQGGDQARARAEGLPEMFRGRRAAMVVDVVASRQRRYLTRVRDIVDAFEASSGPMSLARLAEAGPGDGLGLRAGEAETMREVAGGLHRYASERGLPEEEGVRRWAQEAAPFAFATRLEPYAGAVRGMGPALFAYLRLLSGADALKPDVRVHQALQRLGLDVPNEPNALLLVAQGLAERTGMPMAVLDQFLWWSTQEEQVEATPAGS